MSRGTRGAALNLLNRRLEKPLLALQAAMDGDALIRAVFRVLKAAVRCDFVNVCLRNVRLDHGTVSFRLLDSRGREFDPAMLENVFFREHPAMPVLMANPGIRFINTRETLAPDEVLHGTRFYREGMRVIGFRHAVGMFFWETPPQTPEAIFSLLRGEGQPDFDDAEVAVLDRLYPHVATALRRVQTTEQERGVRRGLHALTHHAPRAACLLDWDLRVAEVNQAARERCAPWHPGADPTRRFKPPPFRLPAPIRAACVELKAHWAASLRLHPDIGVAGSRSVTHPRCPTLRATVALHPAASTPLGKPGFLVEFEDDGPALPAGEPKARGERPDALLGTLNEREQEISRFVCAGMSNQQIATRTGRALGTVKNSLHAIFKKLRVHNRVGLSALLRLWSVLLFASSGLWCPQTAPGSAVNARVAPGRTPAAAPRTPPRARPT